MLSTGIIVSFNGNGYDLVELPKFTRAPFGRELESKEHSSRYDADHLGDPLAAGPRNGSDYGAELGRNLSALLCVRIDIPIGC